LGGSSEKKMGGDGKGGEGDIGEERDDPEEGGDSDPRPQATVEGWIILGKEGWCVLSRHVLRA
jgi:hypothetical protein